MEGNGKADRGRTGRSTKIFASFTAVATLIAMAYLNPALGESFTIHMVYHMILIGVLAPSLLAADFFLWWLPPGTLRKRTLYRTLRRGLYAISYPVTAFILSTAVLWFWRWNPRRGSSIRAVIRRCSNSSPAATGTSF